MLKYYNGLKASHDLRNNKIKFCRNNFIYLAHVCILNKGVKMSRFRFYGLISPSKLYLQLIVTEHGFFAQAAMFIQLERTAIHAKQIAV